MVNDDSIQQDEHDADTHIEWEGLTCEEVWQLLLDGWHTVPLATFVRFPELVRRSPMLAHLASMTTENFKLWLHSNGYSLHPTEITFEVLRVGLLNRKFMHHAAQILEAALTSTPEHTSMRRPVPWDLCLDPGFAFHVNTSRKAFRKVAHGKSEDPVSPSLLAGGPPEGCGALKDSRLPAKVDY